MKKLSTALAKIGRLFKGVKPLDYINTILFVILVAGLIGFIWQTNQFWVRIIITTLLLAAVANLLLSPNKK